MEEINISETESRYYSDLFNVCDVEKKASKVPNLKATEMFRSANLENDILKQVSILSKFLICRKIFIRLFVLVESTQLRKIL